jgi:hypothetical protein
MGELGRIPVGPHGRYSRSHPLEVRICACFHQDGVVGSSDGFRKIPPGRLLSDDLGRGLRRDISSGMAAHAVCNQIEGMVDQEGILLAWAREAHVGG